jgi:predicted nucleic acid-binding protein
MTGRIKTPLDPAEAKQLLKAFEGFHLTIIDQKRIYRAVDLHENEPLSFWDALIISAAEAASCDQVYTEDLNHDQTYGNVTAVNPFSRNDLVE